MPDRWTKLTKRLGAVREQSALAKGAGVRLLEAGMFAVFMERTAGPSLAPRTQTIATVGGQRKQQRCARL